MEYYNTVGNTFWEKFYTKMNEGGAGEPTQEEN
jgi:hypothetical protein